MKKLLSIVTSITLLTVLQSKIYAGAEVAHQEADVYLTKDSGVTTVKPTTPPLTDFRSSSNSHTGTTPRNSTEQRVMDDNMIKAIEAKIVAHRLSEVAEEDVALYLKTNKAEPAKRAFQLGIIEELSKDPTKIKAHAQEIADALERFLVSGASTSTSLNNLTSQQIAMLTAVAETMLQNKQTGPGLTIINQLLRRTKGVELKPATLQLIKRAIVEKNNNAIAQKVITNVLERATKLPLIDAADLIESAAAIGITQAKIQQWNNKIDTAAKAITSQALQQMTTTDLINHSQLIQSIMKRSPETGIDLLTKFIDNSIITPQNFVQLTALHQALINGIKTQGITESKLNNLLAILPKIVRLETSLNLEPEEREIFNTSFTSLLETYLKVLKQEKRIRKEIVNTYVDTYVTDTAKDAVSLYAAAHLAEIAKTEFNASEKYAQWLANIADKASVINNAMLDKLGKVPAQLDAQLKDITQLVKLERLNTLLDAKSLGIFIQNLELQHSKFVDQINKVITQTNKSKIQSIRDRAETINDVYAQLTADLNERLHWLTASY